MPPPLITMIVGFGAVAEGFASDKCMEQHFCYASHAEVLRDHPGFNWKAVVDPSAQARKRAAEIWRVPMVFETIDEAIEHVRPSVAVIASPPNDRLASFKKLERIRGILLEKPVATNLNDVESMAAIAEERSQLVQVNYWRRADNDLTKLLVPKINSLIGELQTAFAIYGNGLHNNGSHLIDLLRFLVDDVDAVLACGYGYPAGPIVGDIDIPFILKLVNGATVHFSTIRFKHYREASLDLWGTRGRLALYNESLSLFHYPLTENRSLENTNEIASDRPQIIPKKRSSAFWTMYDNLYNSLTRGHKLINPLKEAVKTERIIASIIEAQQRKNSWVKVN